MCTCVPMFFVQWKMMSSATICQHEESNSIPLKDCLKERKSFCCRTDTNTIPDQFCFALRMYIIPTPYEYNNALPTYCYYRMYYVYVYSNMPYVNKSECSF